MFTVITKFNPPTNTRGARITVTSEKGKTVFTGGMPGDTPREWHESAIAAHITEMTAIRALDIEDTDAIEFQGYESTSRAVLTPDHSGYVQFWQEV